jgi:hypothetical protein
MAQNFWIPQDKILISETLLRELEEQGRALDRAVTELQRVPEKQRNPDELPTRWQTINLIIHGMLTLRLAFAGRLVTEL